MAASTRNSTTVPLLSAQTFTGTKDTITEFSTALTLIKTDQDCSMKHQYSSDGSNWDFEETFSILAATAKSCESACLGRYFRISITNTSGVDQTYLRCETSYKTASAPGSVASSVEVTAMPDITIAAGQEVTVTGPVTMADGASVIVSSAPHLSGGTDSVMMNLSDGGDVVSAQANGDGHLLVAVPAGVSLAEGSTVALAAGSAVAISPGSSVTLDPGTEVTVSNDLIISVLPAVDLAANSEILTTYKAGLKKYRSLAYSATGQMLSDAPCRFYGLALQNTSSTEDCYVKFYDMASIPANTDTPVLTYWIKAEGSLNIQIPQGLAMDNGLGLRATEALADDDNVSPAGPVIGSIHYL